MRRGCSYIRCKQRLSVDNRCFHKMSTRVISSSTCTYSNDINFQTHFRVRLICLFICSSRCESWKEKKREKDGNFSNILSKAEPMFELAMKPQRSSFLIRTLMSHWRAWGKAKWSLGPLAHSDVLFQTEQLLFNCQRGNDPQCVGVCLVTTNTRHVFIFLV